MSIDIEKFISSLHDVDATTFGKEEISRVRVKNAVALLLSRLQTPIERAWVLMLENPAIFASIRSCMNNGIFERWNKAGGKEASLQEVRGFCKVNPEANLLRRLLRLLSCFHVLEETAEDRWKPTAFSTELGHPEECVAQTIIFGEHHIIQPANNLPGHLAKEEHREPLEPNTGNYKDIYGVDILACCRSDINYQKSFINGFMIGLTTHKVDWTEVYDTQALVDGLGNDSEGGVCLVDLGGAHGIDVTRLLAKHPHLPAGSLIVQDLPDVVELARIDPRIKKEPHDFFTEQPVKGSRAYFLHTVIHDWNDQDARKILGHIAHAMTKDYSKLLLYESVVPPTGADPLLTAIDVGLMYAVSTAERSEASWKRLLVEVGLKIVKIWKHPLAYESMIEAELV